MALYDTNSIIRAFLVTQAGLTALIGGAPPRIYCPRLPENCTLPAISFSTQGGQYKPDVPDVVSPSIQFNCWALDPITARQVYRALYDSFALLLNQTVTIGATTYHILYTQEETQGIDFQDIDIPTYFRTMSYWKLTITAV